MLDIMRRHFPVRRLALLQYGRLRGRYLAKTAPPIVRAVKDDHLSYLETEALTDLYLQVRRVEKLKIPGMIIECGSANGGSSIVLASAKSPSRPMRVYDAFGQIPPPGDKDGADCHERYAVIASGKSEGWEGRAYYGYQPNLQNLVRESFQRHGIPTERNNVELIKGLFDDTIYIDSPVAMAHIDGDWYESVMVCLERIEPHLSVGGVMVIDDYWQFSGCRSALDDYIADKRRRLRVIYRTRLHVQKLA